MKSIKDSTWTEIIAYGAGVLTVAGAILSLGGMVAAGRARLVWHPRSGVLAGSCDSPASVRPVRWIPQVTCYNYTQFKGTPMPQNRARCDRWLCL
jgi:hypothetical protein